jgi:hypothetical protein
MEPRPIFYPVYVSGQYLTSEHLNETHNFLWQEEKATRYILSGNGIVQGLQADFTGTPLQTVTISAGGASTVDGHLVQAVKNLVFNRGVAIDIVRYKLADGSEHMLDKTEFDKVKASLEPVTETALPAIEIIENTVLPADLPDGAQNLNGFAITSAQVLTNYLVFAWVYIKDAENNHCQQADCNTKGVQRNYTVRYFLVQNSLFPQMNTLHAQLPTCAVSRIKNLSKSGSITGFNQRSFDAWSSSAAELSPYFSAANSGKQISIITALLSAADQTDLVAANTKFTQINTSATAANCQQYYNLFAADLANALNELVLYYNDYANKYPSYNANRIERTIILGSLRHTGLDNWRYYFIPAPEQVQHKADKKRLRWLLQRLFAMVNNFTLQNAIVEQSKIVTTKPLIIPTLSACDAPLQNRAIPYYYNVLQNGNNNDLLKFWNPQGGDLKNIFCYYDSKMPGRDVSMAPKLAATDWYNHNFFRIEGHLGMTKIAALTAISNLIVSLGLPVQLIDCNVNYKGPKKWTDWYAEFVGNLAIWTKELRKDYTEYDFQPIKKIQEAITQTSYRDIEGVVKVLNDFNAYSGVFYNPPKQNLNQPATDIRARAGAGTRALSAAKSNVIPTTAYTQYTKVIAKQAVLDLNKNIKDALAEQGDAQAKKLIVLTDLVDMEYMGGAIRGGTFVLLHDGTNVIGDGCLPYYYRIDQSRIFNTAV